MLLTQFKRHRRFVIVVGLTVLGSFVIYSATVPGARDQADDARMAARAAQNEIVSVARDTLESVPALREGGSLSQTIAANRTALAELETKKDELLRTLAYQPPAQYRLPDDLAPEQPAGYQRWFDRVLRELQDEFRNVPAYAIVRSPQLGAAGLLDALGFDVYMQEAQAWAGVAEPAPETRRTTASPFLVRGNQPRGPQRPAEDEAGDRDPERQAERELTMARAETRMKLVLLSVVTKVIEAAIIDEPLRIERIAFVGRGRELTERYRVRTNEACFFRPLRLQVQIESTERGIVRFLHRAIDPGEDRQFLTLDNVQLTSSEALLAEPESDRVGATIELLAFLIDPEQPFQSEDDAARPTAGGRMPFRR